MKRRNRRYAGESPPYIHCPCNSHVYSYACTRTHFSHATKPRTGIPSTHASKRNPSECVSNSILSNTQATQSFQTHKKDAQANSILPNGQAKTQTFQTCKQLNPFKRASRTHKQTQSFQMGKSKLKPSEGQDLCRDSIHFLWLSSCEAERF